MAPHVFRDLFTRLKTSPRGAARAIIADVRNLGRPLMGMTLLIALLAFEEGCAGTTARVLPREGLIARAWAGREPAAPNAAYDVVAFARAQVGKRYCWGGTGPRCFDCSGLAQTAWRSVGARIPRTTQDIAEALPEVALDDVRAGDILWWPGHVGIYAGNGWMIDALDSGHGVVRRPASDPYRAFRPVPRERVVRTGGIAHDRRGD